MKRHLIILAGLTALAACGGGSGPRYAPGTAGITIEPNRDARGATVDVVSKSDLEKRSYAGLTVAQQTLTPAVARRALDVPGATFRRVDDGFVISVPEDPFFTHPSARINPRAMPYMTRLAAALLKDPSARLDIIAHYHYDGMNRKALAESEKRAVAMQAALLSRSVGLSRVRAIGAGDRNPVADNSDPLGQKHNRRIEFHFRRG